MKPKRGLAPFWGLAPLGLLFFLCFSSSLLAAPATGRRAMVVTADPHATAAAIEILEKRGNAVDAAIAAQWVLNVVEPQSSGIGGGGFFLFYETGTQRIYTFDGREQAPAEAFPEMFLDENGNPYPFEPDRITGGLPVGVPGTLKLLKEVHERFGSKRFSFAELFQPAIEIAERGFPISKRLASFIEEEKDRLKIFPDSRRIFLDEKENAPVPGTILKQPELAATFRWIQKEGIDIFYEGLLAQEIADAVRKSPFHPGFMKKEDLADYHVIERQPVRGSYRDFDIFSMGPPSSGGTTLIETLHILEGFDMRLLGKKTDGIHLFAEAQKLAFEDRNQFLGDPDFSEVPLEKLLSKEFAGERSQAIQFETAIPTPEVAVRPLHLEGTHTSHLSIVDEWGNLVAFTTTIEEVFGSAMVVPGRGFLLNNELTDFQAIPKDEEGKLLPNAPEGHKRPRSSMSPAFVFREGRPVMILGSPGGTAIIGTVLNVLLNYLDLEMPFDEAVSSPRIINRGGAVELESGLFQNADLRRELERRGHPVVAKERIGNVQAIAFDRGENLILGVSDPRGEGQAKGY